MANIHLPHGAGGGGGQSVVYSSGAGSGGFVSPMPDTITFRASGDQEMLKVTKEGFYVRGIRVPADEKEAEVVYNAFKRWMVEQELRRPY